MRSLFFWLPLFILTMFACGGNRRMIESAPYVTLRFTDDLGREIALTEPPAAAISLAPSVTEMVFAAGAGSRLVGRSQSSDYPEAALDLPEVISFPEPDFEGIVALKPDLILATDEVLPARYLPALEKLQVPIFIQKFDSLGDVFRNIRQLGKLFGTDSIALPLADSLSKVAAIISERTRGEIPYPAFILVSAEPLIVAGGSGYMNEMLSKAGAKNCFEGLKEKYPTVTAEAIVAADPEFIIVPDENGQLYQQLIAKYPILARTKAAGSGQVFAIDPDLIFRPGPRVIEGLSNLVRVFHPRVELPGLESAGDEE